MSNEKWTDVTVTDLARFGFKAVGAGLIVSLLCAIPIGAIALAIYVNSVNTLVK
jgi:hypothetical protein